MKVQGDPNDCWKFGQDTPYPGFKNTLISRPARLATQGDCTRDIYMIYTLHACSLESGLTELSERLVRLHRVSLYSQSSLSLDASCEAGCWKGGLRANQAHASQRMPAVPVANHVGGTCYHTLGPGYNLGV